jgi:hypothetical protein
VVAAAPNNSLISVTASDDTYIRPAMSTPAGSGGALVVGGTDVATTYLRVQVTSLPTGSGPLTVSLNLVPVRLPGSTVPGVIEVRSVADTDMMLFGVTLPRRPSFGVRSSPRRPADLRRT